MIVAKKIEFTKKIQITVWCKNADGCSKTILCMMQKQKAIEAQKL